MISISTSGQSGRHGIRTHPTPLWGDWLATSVLSQFGYLPNLSRVDAPPESRAGDLRARPGRSGSGLSALDPGAPVFEWTADGSRTHSIPEPESRWSASRPPSRAVGQAPAAEIRTCKRPGIEPDRSAAWRSWRAAEDHPDGVEPSFPGCDPSVVAGLPRPRDHEVVSRRSCLPVIRQLVSCQLPVVRCRAVGLCQLVRLEGPRQMSDGPNKWVAFCGVGSRHSPQTAGLRPATARQCFADACASGRAYAFPWAASQHRKPSRDSRSPSALSAGRGVSQEARRAGRRLRPAAGVEVAVSWSSARRFILLRYEPNKKPDVTCDTGSLMIP